MNLGDEWKVERVYANFKIEGVDVFIEYIDKEAEDPDIFKRCLIYDYTLSRCWRHLDTMQYKTCIDCSVPRIKSLSGKVKTIKVPWSDGYERHTIHCHV